MEPVSCLVHLSTHVHRAIICIDIHSPPRMIPNDLSNTPDVSFSASQVRLSTCTQQIFVSLLCVCWWSFWLLRSSALANGGLISEFVTVYRRHSQPCGVNCPESVDYHFSQTQKQLNSSSLQGCYSVRLPAVWNESLQTFSLAQWLPIPDKWYIQMK